MQDYVGKQIDRYRITERLGMGGMAVVYKAYDTRLEREVALKLIRTEQIPPIELDRILERFRREAKNLAKLTDVPGVVTLLDYGIYEQKPYMVMSFLPGGTLKDLLGEPMDAMSALQQLQPIVEALVIIHEMDIIHRDIKPSNLLINRFGKLALADFGIAKAFESGEYTLTGTGMGVGTPDYMAPEQWRGKTVAQSDIYSLGVVYYEMITGKKPFEADTATDLFLKIMTEPLKDPRELVPSVPEAVSRFVKGCLARELDQRLPSAAQLLVEMQRLLKPPEVETVTPESVIPRPLSQTPVTRELLDAVDEFETWDAYEEGERIAVVQPPKQDLAEYGEIKKQVVYLGAGISMAFVKVPAGEFIMGARSEDHLAEWNEKPQHVVYLDAYWIGETPVTNQQYEVFCQAAGDEFYYPSEKADHPVVSVSWFEAQDFCKWLTRKTGKQIQLPTEQEWEKAARGTDGRIYPWGNAIKPSKSLANYSGLFKGTTPVNKFLDNISPFGALDMAGNILEWTCDLYEDNAYYQSSKSVVINNSQTKNRSVRGGSWNLAREHLRCSFRSFIGGELRFPDVGFRCVLKP